MGAANVEPAPLMVPEPDADVPPLDDELLHAAPASRTATATTPAAARLEAARLDAARLDAALLDAARLEAALDARSS
jgi:hypothetical protein